VKQFFMKTKLPKKSTIIAPILQNFQADLLKVYGEHLQKIILFGSYARGDFRESSDIDLLLLFDEYDNITPKDDEIYDKIAAIILENKYVISLIPTTLHLFETKKAPLYLNIKKEGIELWRK
jgi:predicted nucleotidyltransferase